MRDSVCWDVLGAVSGWLCRGHLAHPLVPAQLNSARETSSNILPSLSTLLPSLSDCHLHQLQQLLLPVLELVYWCVVLVLSEKKMKNSLSATLRRIGDCVYRPMVCVCLCGVCVCVCVCDPIYFSLPSFCDHHVK